MTSSDILLRFFKSLLTFDLLGEIWSPLEPCDVISRINYLNKSKLENTIEFSVQKLVIIPNFTFLSPICEELLRLFTFCPYLVLCDVIGNINLNISRNIHFQTMFLIWKWISIKFPIESYIIHCYITKSNFHLNGGWPLNPFTPYWGTKKYFQVADGL